MTSSLTHTHTHKLRPLLGRGLTEYITGDGFYKMSANQLYTFGHKSNSTCSPSRVTAGSRAAQRRRVGHGVGIVLVNHIISVQ